jgi:hypothetical protein
VHRLGGLYLDYDMVLLDAADIMQGQVSKHMWSLQRWCRRILRCQAQMQRTGVPCVARRCNLLSNIARCMQVVLIGQQTM